MALNTKARKGRTPKGYNVLKIVAAALVLVIAIQLFLFYKEFSQLNSLGAGKSTQPGLVSQAINQSAASREVPAHIFNTCPPGSNSTSFISGYNNSRCLASSEINASNVAALREGWVIHTAGFVTSSPVVLNGTVYFSDWNGNVYSANAATGKLLWEAPLGIMITSTPALSGGMVYVGGGSGRPEVLALYQKNGTVAWKTFPRTNMPNIWASPTVYDGLVYIGVSGVNYENEPTNGSEQNGAIFALDVASGNVAWRYNTMVGDTGGAGVWGSAVVDPALNSIYFGTGSTSVNGANSSYAYSIFSMNATTGAPKWIFSAYNNSYDGQDYDFGSTPNLFSLKIGGAERQAIGLGSKNGFYYVLDRANGTLLDKFQVGQLSPPGFGPEYPGIFGLAALAYNGSDPDPEVFIPSSARYPLDQLCCGAVEAADPSNGSVLWQFNTTDVLGSVSAVPGAILFGTAGGSYTGLYSDERNLSEVGYGNLYALSSESGNVLFNASLPTPVAAGVAVNGNQVIVPTLGGVYSFSN